MRASTRRPGHTSRPAVVVTSLAAVAALLVSCGDSTGPGSSSFAVEVTGATNRSYTGDALALPDPEFGYALILESAASEGPNQIEILLAREEPGFPDEGTYDIVDFLGEVDPLPEDFAGSLNLSVNTETERSCRALEGSITFTSTSNSGASGSFAFTMVCTMTEDPEAPAEDASVEGTFEALSALVL